MPTHHRRTHTKPEHRATDHTGLLGMWHIWSSHFQMQDRHTIIRRHQQPRFHRGSNWKANLGPWLLQHGNFGYSVTFQTRKNTIPPLSNHGPTHGWTATVICRLKCTFWTTRYITNIIRSNKCTDLPFFDRQTDRPSYRDANYNVRDASCY